MFFHATFSSLSAIAKQLFGEKARHSMVAYDTSSTSPLEVMSYEDDTLSHGVL
jgi:hypothetical protein